MQSDAFIAALPKAELHLHIEGAVPWELARARNPALPPIPPWWDDAFVFHDFAVDFAQAMRACYLPVLRTVDDYAQVAAMVLADLAAQNVRYAELSFSSRYLAQQGLAVADVARAIKQAAPAGIVVLVYAGISREQLYPLDDPLVQAILAAPELDGLDLHGDERRCGATPYAAVFAAAGERGLRLKAHAGELAGAGAVAETLDALGVTRIEHGVTAAGEPALVERLIAEEVTLDMCPTSNVKLGAVPSLAEHPIHLLHRRGVRVTVNTDDPTIFGCSLTDELQLLVDRLGFSLVDIAQLQTNAFRVARLPQAIRAKILAEVAGLLARSSAPR
jgi:adenosine deaminase